MYFLCRDVGVKAIENLMEKKGKFDYILLETTGLADPGPIASMFWLDEGLGSEIYLDGKIRLCLYFSVFPPAYLNQGGPPGLTLG